MSTKNQPHFNQATLDRSLNKKKIDREEFAYSMERQSVRGELIRQNKPHSDKAVEEYINANKVQFNIAVRGHINSIASTDYNGIEATLTNRENSVLIMNRSSFKSKEQGNADFVKAQETYRSIKTGFYDYIRDVASNGTKKTQTGTELMSAAVSLDGHMAYQYSGKGVSIPVNQMIKANENIIAKKKFVAFDLETMGGVDATGQQTLDGITEFWFGKADAKTGVIADGEHRGSIIGQGPKQHSEYTKIIEKVSLGQELTGREKVISGRLNKIGHKNTASVETSPGIFKYTSFASDSDVLVPSTVDMKRGADRLLATYHTQQATKKVKYYGEMVLPHERQFAEALDWIGQEGLTAVSHNGGRFDKNTLENAMGSGMFTNGMNAAMNNKDREYFNWQNKHLDTFAAARASKRDWMQDYGSEIIAQMNEENLTHGTLKASSLAYDKGFQAIGVEHAAEFDTRRVSSLYANSGLYDPANADKYIFKGASSSIETKLEGDGKQLFYALNGMGSKSNNGVLGFTEEEYNNIIRTFSGFSISEDGSVEKDLFKTTGIQAHASYTIDSINSFTTTPEFRDIIKETHPQMAVKDLAVMKISAVSKGKIGSNYKENASSYYIATADNLASFFNQDLLLTGYKNSDGEYVEYGKDTRIGREIAELMGESQHDRKTGTSQNYEFSAENQLIESETVLQNEAAARAMRDLNINKERNLLNYVDNMESYADANIENEITTGSLGKAVHDSEAIGARRIHFRDEFRRRVRENSEETAKKISSGNLTGVGVEFIKTFNSHWQYPNSDMKVYRQTIDASNASIDRAFSMKEITRILIRAAEEDGAKDPAFENFLFKQYHMAVQGHVAKKSGKSIDYVNNKFITPKRKIFDNMFDINIANYIKDQALEAPGVFENTSNIHTVNLKDSNFKLIDTLLKKKKLSTNITKEEKRKELHSFGMYLSNSGIANFPRNLNIANETVETITRRIVSSLVDARGKNNNAGRLIDPKTQFATSESMLAELVNTSNGMKGVTGAIKNARKIVPTLVTATRDGNNIRSLAEEITDKVLFDIVTTGDLIKDGMSKKEAKNMMSMRRIRRNDTVDFMHDLISGIVGESDSNIVYDKKTKRVHIIDANGVPTELHNLPRDRYQDGRIFTQIGNMSVANPVGFYGPGSDKGDLKFQSKLGNARRKTPWIKSSIRRGMENGNVSGSVIGAISDFSETLRTGVSVMKGGPQEQKVHGKFEFDDIAHYLQYNHKNKMYDGVKFEFHSDFMKMLEDKKFDPSRLTPAQMNLIKLNHTNLLEAQSRNLPKDQRDIIKAVTATGKGASYTILKNRNPDALARGINDQMAGRIYNEKKVTDAINSKLLKGITVGAALYNPVSVANANRKLHGLSYSTNDKIGVNFLNITDRDYKHVIGQHKSGSRYIDEMLGLSSVLDGGMVADPNILDYVYQDRQSTHKIPIRKVSEHNLNILKDISKKKKMAPKVYIENGVVKFGYSNGFFVDSAAELLSLHGYKDTNAQAINKEYGEGMFRFGMFTKSSDHLVAQSNLEKVLNMPGNIERMREHAKKSPESLEAKAVSILEETFSAKYYVSKYDANPHQKMIMEQEKGMTNFLMAGVGTSEDSAITGTLKDLGLEGRIGSTPNVEYLDSLLQPDIENTALGSLINHGRKKQLNHADITSIINQRYNSAEDFKTSLAAERRAPWESEVDMLRNAGLVRANEDVSVIGDTTNAKIKHNNASAEIESNVSGILYANNGDVEKTRQSLSKAIPGISNVKGHLTLPDNMSVNINEMKTAIENSEINKDALRTEEVGGRKVSASLAHTTMTASIDYDGISAKTKLGKANFMRLEFQHYSGDGLDRIRKSWGDDEFNRVYGRVAEISGESTLVRDEYKNVPIAKGVSDLLRESSKYNSGENRAYTTVDGALSFNKKFINGFKEKGINIEPVLHGLIQDGTKNASAEYAENIYALSSGVAAREWNAGRSSLSDMRKVGFVDGNMSTISSTGGNKGIDEKLYQRNMLIDLHIPEFGDNQLYSTEADQFLALPYTPEKWVSRKDGEEARVEFHKNFSRLQSRVERYKEETNPNEKKEIMDSMKNDITIIKNTVSSSLDKKKGLLREVSDSVMNGAAYYKASVVDFYPDTRNAYLDALHFDGKNIIDEARKKVDYSVSFGGREHFDNIYKEDTLKTLGIDREALYGRLKTEGSISVTTRYPAENINSTTPTVTYFSDTISGNRLIAGRTLSESRDGDIDGDAISTIMMNLKSKVTMKDGTTKVLDIDKTLHDMINSTDGMNSELTAESQAAHDDAVRMIHYNANNENTKYVQHEDAQAVISDPYGTSISEGYAVNGKVRSQRVYNLTTNRAEKHLEIYNKINDHISENYGQEAAAGKVNSKAYRDYASSAIEEMTKVGSSDRRRYNYAFEYGVSYKTQRSDTLAKMGKESAGQAHSLLTPNLELIDYVSRNQHALEAITPEEKIAAHGVSKAIQETFLSPKNESEINLFLVDSFKEATKLMFKGDKQPMIDLLMNNVLESKEIKVENINAAGTLPEKIITPAESIQIYSSIAERANVNPNTRNISTQVTSIDGGAADRRFMTSGEGINEVDRLMRTLQVVQESQGVESRMIDSVAYAQVVPPRRAAELIGTNAVQPTISREAENEIGDAVSNISRRMSSSKLFTGKTLAFGALGLAGATMIASFAGGNPTKPAEMHAEDESNNNQAIPQLSDNNINAQRGGPKQGYIININAQTQKGRDHATSAVHQAMSSGFSSNVNIAMNINQSGSNITNRNIEAEVRDALG